MDKETEETVTYSQMVVEALSDIKAGQKEIHTKIDGIVEAIHENRVCIATQAGEIKANEKDIRKIEDSRKPIIAAVINAIVTVVVATVVAMAALGRLQC